MTSLQQPGTHLLVGITLMETVKLIQVTLNKLINLNSQLNKATLSNERIVYKTKSKLTHLKITSANGSIKQKQDQE